MPYGFPQSYLSLHALLETFVGLSLSNIGIMESMTVISTCLHLPLSSKVYILLVGACVPLMSALPGTKRILTEDFGVKVSATVTRVSIMCKHQKNEGIYSSVKLNGNAWSNSRARDF
jgi:hypothetical protein